MHKAKEAGLFFLIVVSCGVISAPPCSADSTASIGLAQCDFWLATVIWDKLLMPLGGCKNGQWFPSRTEDFKSIPDGNYEFQEVSVQLHNTPHPPPVEWLVISSGTFQKAVVQSLSFDQFQSLLLEIDPPPTPYTVAYHGSITVQTGTWPDTEDALAKKALQALVNHEFARLVDQRMTENKMHRKTLHDEDKNSKSQGEFKRFVSPKSGQSLYYVSVQMHDKLTGSGDDQERLCQFSYAGWYRKEGDQFHEFFSTFFSDLGADEKGAGGNVPYGLLNIVGHDVFVMEQRSYDDEKGAVMELDNGGKFQTIFTGPTIGG